MTYIIQKYIICRNDDKRDPCSLDNIYLCSFHIEIISSNTNNNDDDTKCVTFTSFA